MAEFNLIVPSFLLDYRSVTLYQEWLNLGNEGTMADFIAWLRTPATEAAGIALQAAATANAAIQEMATALQEAEDTAAVWAAAEAGRASAENGRVTAETGRTTAEGLRVTAETTRGANETGRQTAETVRTSAESLRATAETGRTTAESGRVTAENTRGTTETARQTAEGGRATAETGRVTAESGRAAAETGRTTAESARVSAETTRGANETGRQTAETARIGAESSRATAETGRTTAETARVTAENARNVASNAYNLTVQVPLSAGQYYTATTARAAIPANVRKLGLKITYATSAGVWVEEQFVGGDVSGWATKSNWILLPKVYVNEPYLSKINQIIGVTPTSGLSLGSNTYFHAVKSLNESLLKSINIVSTMIGAAKIKVITENQDGSVNLHSETLISVNTLGNITLNNGTDFNNIIIPKGAYICLFCVSGGLLYTYSSNNSNNYYTVIGDLTGNNNSKSLTTTNQLLIKFEIESIEKSISTKFEEVDAKMIEIENKIVAETKYIGVNNLGSGSSVGSNTYVHNYTSEFLSKLKSVSLFINTIGTGKIKVLSQNEDGTLNVYSDTLINVASTGLVTLNDGTDFENILVPEGAYVCVYGDTLRYSFKSGTSVNYFDLNGEPIGDNIVKGTLRTTNEIQVKFELVGVNAEIVFNAIEEKLNLLNDNAAYEIYNSYKNTITVDGLLVNYSIILSSNNIEQLKTGNLSISPASIITGETMINKALNYTSSTVPVGILDLKNSNGDKVKNVSNLVVKRNSNSTVLVDGVDYRKFLTVGKISGANSSVSTLQVDVYFDYAKERVDLLQISQLGIVSLVQGTERFRDAIELQYIAKPTAGSIPLAYIIVKGNSCTAIDLSNWDNKFFKGSENELFKSLEYNKSVIYKSLKKLNAGGTFKLVGYGDSITQCGYTTGAYTPNGVNRDNVAYLENFATDILNSIGLFDFADGGGSVHTKIGWNWKLKTYLESKYSTNVNYLNFGIGGTTSGDTINNGLYPARLNAVLSEVPDLCILAFGMNEIGSNSTYTNMLSIISQLKAIGTDCIVMGCPRPSSNMAYNYSDWLKTNNALKKVAIDTESAFVPFLYFTTNERVGFFGSDFELFCTANMYNHPGPREFSLYGEMLKMIF